MDNKRNQIKMICTRDKMFLKFQKEKSPLLRGDLFQKYKAIAWLELLETVKTSTIFAILMRILKIARKYGKELTKLLTLKRKHDLLTSLLNILSIPIFSLNIKH